MTSFKDALKRVFGGKPKEPQNRVFVVEDAALKKALLDVVRDNVERLNKTLTGLFTGNNSLVHESFNSSAPRAGERIEALIGWPKADHGVQVSPGLWMGVRGPEIVLHKGDVHIVVPDAQYYERRGGDAARFAKEIGSWAPPAGLREADKCLFGPQPVGVPTVTPHESSLKQAGLPGVVPRPW